MRETTPIYREADQTFHVDSCRPQIAAARAGKITIHSIARGGYPGVRLGPGELEGIRSAGFWDAVGEQDWGLEWHRNEGIEIVYLEAGRVPFAVEDRHVVLEPGSLTITRPWQAHVLGDPCIGPSRLHWVVLDVGVRRPNQEWTWPSWVVLTPADLNKLTRKLRYNERPVWTGTPGIAQTFRQMAACHAADRRPQVSRLAILLNQMLVELLDLIDRQKVTEDESLASRLRTVELFLRDLKLNPRCFALPWTLPGMACHCGIGVTTFCSHCRTLTNASPLQYLTQCRLEAAARRLREQPGRAVTDIAFEVGFSTSQYFATVFRHHFRCTPREYRARNAGRSPHPAIPGPGRRPLPS